MADEPTGNLDPELSREIMRLFEEFNRVGMTLLIASHDLALISTLEHRILTLSGGALVAGGVSEAESEEGRGPMAEETDGASGGEALTDLSRFGGGDP